MKCNAHTMPSVYSKYIKERGFRAFCMAVLRHVVRYHVSSPNRRFYIRHDIAIGCRHAIAVAPRLCGRLMMSKQRIFTGFRCPAHPFSLINVHPATITEYLVSSVDEGHENCILWSHYEKAGQIIDGDWDQLKRPVQQHWKYQDLEDRYVHRKPWKDTQHYRWLRGRGSTDREAMAALHKYDRLYADIRDHGYRIANFAPKSRLLEEICVCIGRKGEILFANNGWHRFMITRIQGKASVPMRVILRHLDWQLVREHYARCIKKNKPIGDELMPFYDHPDLQDILKQESREAK